MYFVSIASNVIVILLKDSNRSKFRNLFPEMNRAYILSREFKHYAAFDWYVLPDFYCEYYSRG